MQKILLLLKCFCVLTGKCIFPFAFFFFLFWSVCLMSDCFGLSYVCLFFFSLYFIRLFIFLILVITVFLDLEAVVRRYSSKQVFLKVSQYSQKKTYVGVSVTHGLESGNVLKNRIQYDEGSLANISRFLRIGSSR